MNLSPGDVFLMEYPHDKNHYHVVVKEIVENLLVCVFISSVKPGIIVDDACLIQPGELSFIKHESYIVYRTIPKVSIKTAELFIENGTYVLTGEKVPEEMMDRIKKGALKSRFISKKDKQLFIE